MKYPRPRLLAPEPGDTGGTDTGAAPAQSAAPEVTQDPPAAPEPEVVKVETGHGDENTAKITALLDGIGKPEDDPKPTAQEKPTDKPAEVKDKPKAEDDDLTPPEGASEKAKGRWAQLAERAKQVPDLEKRATEAETALASVREMVQQSGLAQDEFAGMLEMGRLFKSADPNDLQTALKQLDGLRADLATRLGVDAPGIDLLSKHADLAADVENMSITRERALEIAKLRDQQARLDAQNRANQEQTQFQKTIESAASQMDEALAKRAATPGHAEKLAFIQSKLREPGVMQQFVTTYQPNQWQSAILMMYDAYTPPPPAAPPAPQPLRPGYVASGTRQIGSKPVTAEESVEHAWASAGLPG